MACWILSIHKKNDQIRGPRPEIWLDKEIKNFIAKEQDQIKLDLNMFKLL